MDSFNFRLHIQPLCDRVESFRISIRFVDKSALLSFAETNLPQGSIAVNSRGGGIQINFCVAIYFLVDQLFGIQTHPHACRESTGTSRVGWDMPWVSTINRYE